MYDQQTSQLIQSVPPIDGVETKNLPELLTETFLKIATLRLRINDSNIGREDELAGAMARLRVLAEVLEVHAAIAVDSLNRQAAAYVSATAHQLLSQIKQLTGKGTGPSVAISARSISPRISAALLFLMSGYPADAAEVLRSAGPPQGDDFYAPLIAAVVAFCEGNMSSVIGRRQIQMPEYTDDDVQAEFVLWGRTLRSLRIMAARFIQQPVPEDLRDGDVEGLLKSVQDDSVVSMSFPESAYAYQNVYTTFAGPHHLATLLLAAARGLEGRGLVDAPLPDGPPPDKWMAFIRSRARNRPFLWTNHMDALRQGLLNVGKSAVISFPTGAGKSTLAELKIASTILSGKKVVYLAPTLALVGQVSRNLKQLLPQNKVGASEIEDQMYSLLNVPLSDDVWVMTPERCLLLVTVCPEEFESVGLVVFDECHAMHMTSESASQRGVDAMLCLLKLMNAAPAADVLLMSALMSNGDELADWLRKSYGKDVLIFDAAWKPTRQARGSIVFPSDEITRLHQLASASPKKLPQKSMLAHPFSLLCLKQTWHSNHGSDYRIMPLSNQQAKLKAERDKRGHIQIKLDSSGLAIHIALRAASLGLKSIVFFHVTSSVTASVRKVGEDASAGTLSLNEREQALLAAITLELGGSEYAFLPNSVAGGHHGQLLPYVF